MGECDGILLGGGRGGVVGEGGGGVESTAGCWGCDWVSVECCCLCLSGGDVMGGGDGRWCSVWVLGLGLGAMIPPFAFASER